MATDPKIRYVDMDGVLVDFETGVDRLDEETRARYAGRLDEVPEIFGTMEPMPGALEAYRKLAEVYDTYILSTAPWENESAWIDKIRWVKRHLGDVAHKRLTLTHHKDLVRGHFLIDDRTKNGAAQFPGVHIHFGSDRFPDWSAVLAYLLPKA